MKSQFPIMKKLWPVFAMLAITLACGGKKVDVRPQGDEPAALTDGKASQGPQGDEPATLTVGMDWQAANALLASDGAEDVSRSVGITFLLYPGLAYQQARWMVLGDNTCIAILGGGASLETMIVVRILIGVTGAGYEDKIIWSQTSREVTSVDLAQHRKAH